MSEQNEGILKSRLEAEITQTEPAPRPYQIEALADIKEAFSKADRATISWVCGTGKTLLAAFAAKEMNCSATLYLAPSIHLVWQTWLEWSRLSHWRNVAVLRICSKELIYDDKDSVRMSPEEAGCTTDPEDVVKFFADNVGKPKLIIGTYHSSKLLSGLKFDLGIFDEAHRTAGLPGSAFTFALENSNIPIKKRLFQTATVVDRKKAWKGDKRVNYTMGDETIYGKVCNFLSFPKVTELGIVCDYKIVVVVVTSDEVKKTIENITSIVKSGRRHCSAMEAAQMIALKKAWWRWKFKKVFSFHGRIEQARRFADQDHENCIFKNVLPEFDSSFVHGNMAMNQRFSILEEFRNNSRPSLVASVTCLGEGQNTPAADAALLCVAKKTKTAVVQNVGRIMRKSPGKKYGFVILPLFLTSESLQPQVIGKNGEKQMNPEDLSETSGFRRVWETLEALKENDAVLRDLVDTLRKSKGETGEIDLEEMSKVIDIIGVPVGMEWLEKNIKVQIAENLGSIWSEMFGKWTAYKNKTGNPNPPVSEVKLHRWCNTQRNEKFHKVLPQHREEMLNSEGFVWSINNDAWEKKYQGVLKYVEEFGHLPQGISHFRYRGEDGYSNGENKITYSLNIWLNSNRSDMISSYRKNKNWYPSERQLKLMDLCVANKHPVFEGRADDQVRFQAKMAAVIEYKKIHETLPPKGHPLFVWYKGTLNSIRSYIRFKISLNSMHKAEKPLPEYSPWILNFIDFFDPKLKKHLTID